MSDSRTQRQFLTTNQVAEMIGVHPLTIIRWRREGRFLPYVRFGRAVRYRLADLELHSATQNEMQAAA